MFKVEFVALPDQTGTRDGGNGYSVYVNEKQVIDWISSDLNVSDKRFNDLWKVLGVKLQFDKQ